MEKRNKKKICIGILGGGQLARMSAIQAYKLGFDVAILEKEINSPAGQLTKNDFAGWVDDRKVLKKFAAKSDIITLENEFIDYKKLEYLESLGKKIRPSSNTISLIQDKFIQKETLKRNKIPIVDFIEICEVDDYTSVAEKLGKKFLLKSRVMGYDGYGNYTVNSAKSFDEGMKKLRGRNSKLYAEQYIDFRMELAVIVVRTKYETITYSVVETIQKNHICHSVIAPARIDKKLSAAAKEIAIESVYSVNGFGLFGVELFLGNDNKILVNELAPRPHNSGHYTIEACVTSQFENHIRAVLDLPLGSTGMINKYSVMVNLLGKKNAPGIIEDYNTVLKNDNIHFHLYGKEFSRPGRKMGHITVNGDDLIPLLNLAEKTAKKIII
jgi:5-(carboxyamino)imidazole ribonucleotide synthase